MLIIAKIVYCYILIDNTGGLLFKDSFSFGNKVLLGEICNVRANNAHGSVLNCIEELVGLLVIGAHFFWAPL